MKKLLIIILCTAVMLALLCGSFLYVTRYRITDIDTSSSTDGVHELIFQAVGEPDFPFGPSHARIVLKEGNRTVTKYQFDVANDGGVLRPENWTVKWQDSCVHAVISGEEQNDAMYTFYFDSTTDVCLSALTVELSSLVSVNERGESVFAASVYDFIDCYNSVYKQYHAITYLKELSSDEWYCRSELSPRFGYESVRYEFSEDRTVWPMPTVSIYAPDNDEIYEIRMSFDDHGYQDELYCKYKELCACLLKMACPELSDVEIENVFCELYSLSDENFFGDHHAYGDPERPPLSRLLRSGNIGFYCFYGSGDIEICMIPLTPTALELLESEGVDVQSMQEHLHN